MPPNLSWGDSRLYAVLQRTLDEDCRQTEELKQLVDEASWFHLRCQCQHSAVICTLLLSSRVLCPSLVTLCSHKSGRCAVELYHDCYLCLRSTPLSALQQLVKFCFYHTFTIIFSPTLNRQPYKGRLPLTSWWRKLSNMTVG